MAGDCGVVASESDDHKQAKGGVQADAGGEAAFDELAESQTGGSEVGTATPMTSAGGTDVPQDAVESPCAACTPRHAPADEARDYQFAPRYSTEDLLRDVALRRRFLRDFLRAEGAFLRRGAGLSNCGLTYDGAHIVGGTSLRARSHSNPSKEALHISLLALVISRDGLARELFSAEEALEQLGAKAATLEAYRDAHPELCGFMPWFDADAGGRPLEPEQAVRYSGMLGWALYFLVHVLEDAGEGDLADRFRAHLDVMRASAVRLAYKGQGKVASRVSVAPRGVGVPMRSEQSCEDPFAGELFCLFLDLLGDWDELPSCERDSIWEDAARTRWVTRGSLEVESNGSSHTLEAMFGSTFSAHEDWKYLFLPYAEVSVCRRLLHSSARVRTWWARSKGLPGLLGDCHAPAGGADANGGAGPLAEETRHVTSFGIPGISGLQPDCARKDYVAASGTLGLLLADDGVGAAWLHSTLAANSEMQTPWGVAESCSSDGSVVCPMLTWDAKATTALAVLGGLGGQMRRYMERDHLFARFASRLDALYAPFAAFSRPLAGELTGFALPPGVGDSSSSSCSGGAEAGAEVAMGMDLQLAEAVRGKTLPPSDGWRLAEVRRWFEEHEGEPGRAPYCTGTDQWEPYEDWYTTGRGHFDPGSSEADRVALYRLVAGCFSIGVPLVLLARQAPLYPLFFDLDLYGGREDDGSKWDEVHRVAWEDEDKLLLRSIVEAVLEVYPQFRSSLEVAVFCSSGLCSKHGRFKASYHVVFPAIAVDRPVKCWPEQGWRCERLADVGGVASAAPPGHLAVRNHAVCRLTEASAVEGGVVQELQEDLLRCCSWDRVTPLYGRTDGEEEEVGGDDTFLNDWTEVLDEYPLWHEPWPQAATGLRLPFTDKPGEGRPKRPLGRWLFSSSLASSSPASCPSKWPPPSSVTRLPDLDDVDWVRLGDISVCDATAPTPWAEAALHEAARAECRCPECG